MGIGMGIDVGVSDVRKKAYRLKAPVRPAQDQTVPKVVPTMGTPEIETWTQ